MSRRNVHRRASTLTAGLAVWAAVAAASVAVAGDAPATTSPSPEMRAKMATLHEQMAACLRSDKPMSECRAQMMKGCQDMMGKDGCSMMMGGGMMKGMHDHTSPPAHPSDHP